MKKKFFISALSVIVFTMCAVGLIACTTKGGEHTHDWGKWTSDDIITHTRTCNCGESETKNHTWDNGVETKNATCKETGIKTYTCLECGQTRTETIERSTVHSWGKWTSVNDTSHTRACLVCNTSETKSHNWNSGEITKKATCKESGITTYTCIECGKTKTETIDKLTAHSWGKWTSVNEETHTHSCTSCGERETQNHNFVGETCKDCGFSFLPATVTSVDNATMDYVNSSIDMLVNKNTTSVNLSNMVKVSPNSSWKLYTSDSSLIATKYANLQDGENTYLIVVSSADGLYDNTYTLNIYKSFEITVSYYNVYNSVIHTDIADTGYEYKIDYTPEIIGYTFNHWELENKQTTTFTPFGNIKIYPDCTVNSYTLNLNADGGEVAESKKQVEFDSSYMLPVPTKTGHTFKGWYVDNTKITNADGASINNSKFATETEITANWQINSYKVTVEYDNYSHGSVAGGGTYDYDTSVTVEATTKAGYTFIGWYNGETLLDGNLSYTFAMPAKDVTYTSKWCKVATVSNNMSAGTVNALNSTYISNEKVSISAVTKSGYTFIGWFVGEVLLSHDLIYTVKMPFVDTVYTAKWCKVTVEQNIYEGGNISPSSSDFNYRNTYITGEIVKVTASTPNLGYDWLGWYNGDTLLTADLSYTIVMPSKDTTYMAKWNVKPEMQMFDFYSTETDCTINELNDKTLSEVIIPDYVTSIYATFYNGVFYGCNNLTSVKIGNSVTSIGDYAFRGCSGLTSIIIPDSVTSIGGWAFRGCSELTSIVIPNSVTDIGNGAFSECSGLTSIVIPNSVTDIGNAVFSGCSGLTIYCEATDKPGGWDISWNGSDGSVVWNFKNNEI